MTGKEKCDALRQIRREVAKANGIGLPMEDCDYPGECAGTCPKCEEELRLLEGAIDAREKSGAAVALKGIAAGVLEKRESIQPNPQPRSPQSTDFDGPLLAGVPVMNDNVSICVRYAEGTDGREWKQATRRVRFFSSVLIGRADTCDIVIRNPTFSREQFSLSVNGGFPPMLYLENRGRTNTAFINGRPFTGQVLLKGGEEIRVGTVRLRIDTV